MTDPVLSIRTAEALRTRLEAEAASRGMRVSHLAAEILASRLDYVQALRDVLKEISSDRAERSQDRQWEQSQFTKIELKLDANAQQMTRIEKKMDAILALFRGDTPSSDPDPQTQSQSPGRRP